MRAFRSVVWLFAIPVIVLYSEPADAVYKLYSFDNTQGGSQWTNLAGAFGWNPACDDCTCSNSSVARNNQSGGFQRLFCGDFRDSNETYWELADNELVKEVVTRVQFDVHGRYTGVAGGSFNCQVDIGGTIVQRNPNNSFTNNGICRWRIPDAYQDLTTVVDWNADPSLFDSIEIGVQRNSNNTEMCVNAVRLRVQTARAEIPSDTISYDPVLVGGFHDESFEILSNGDDTLNGNVVLNTPCQGFSIISGGGPFSLPTGQTRLVVVRFAPATADLYACEVSLGIRDLVVSLDGEGLEPTCLVSETTHDFGIVPLGSSVDWTFTVQNVEGGILTGTVAMDPEFCDTQALNIIGGAGTFSLAQDESHSVTVRFTPTSDDLFSCYVDLGTDYCPGVTMNGEGILGSCFVSTAAHDFGDVPIGEAVDWALFVENRSANPVAGNVALDEFCDVGAFSVIAGGGTYLLQPGERLDVTIRFLPPTADYFLCDVNVGCGDGNVELEGVGTDVTAVVEARNPSHTSVAPPRPNPFQSETVIELALASPIEVDVNIFDVTGKRVRSIEKGRLDVGYHSLMWNARTDRGERVAPGVYFAEVRLGNAKGKVLRLVLR